MVQTCAVRGCGSTWCPGGDIRFHAFPKNITQRKLWLSIVPLKLKSYESTRICSLHFQESDYNPSGSLKQTAVPTIIINQEVVSSCKKPDNMDLDDKLSIKNILFTKSLPNYKIPAPIDGHKMFPCIDCGDKFLFESSLEDHLNRKSVQITYMCRFCNQTKIFFNRCKLLFHIRSHAFKTATINVNDLKVEPIPLTFYKKPIQKPPASQFIDLTQKMPSNVSCFECKQSIETQPGNVHKDRANHFMQFTNEVYNCPVCLFTLPTLCGLRAHLRFHINRPPFYCPECGYHLQGKKFSYPYRHDCEGFKMMRATTRLKCPILSCLLYHPNDIKEHMKESHLKKVFKCAYCVVACFNEATMNSHLEGHSITDAKAVVFYQCELCPGRLVVQGNLENHLRTHTNAPIFPCWSCGNTYKDVSKLIGHHILKHETNATESMKNLLFSFKNNFDNQQIKRIYRVVKRCDHCQRNFTYKCNSSEISVLPNECPFKCLPKSKSTDQLTCFMCKEKISEDWQDIKKHYANHHKTHKCIDPRVVLQKVNLSKFKVKKRARKPKATRIRQTKVKQQETIVIEANPSGNYCTICKTTCESKEQLESHFLTHKDPCAAYQCMECGQSFIVKPSFSTHLKMEHGVSDVDAYISNKACYNENALDRYQNNTISFEPLKENQCKICREQFENAEDLAQHFRGHGMAFLLKSTNKTA